MIPGQRNLTASRNMHRQFGCVVAIDVIAPVNYLQGDVYTVPAAVANRKAFVIRVEYLSTESDRDSVG